MNNELTVALLTIEKCRELSGCPADVYLQDWVKKLAAENVALKGIVSEINNELYGQGLEVAGWHLNGALEPLDNWFTDNGWGEPETPATDRIVAGIKADGVEQYAALFADTVNMEREHNQQFHKGTLWFAKQLREGADK
ncbi:hypothetical protein AWS46_03010 [Klebsiella aerogenes]|nr:hypothetical protein AWS47_10845 [Klebsiella aerogenes]KVI72540.1 hypothetical protein AWS46_03010 [Klebsiella aerogenes]